MRTLIGLSLLLGACGGAQNTAPQAVEAPADEQTKTEVALVHNIRTETVEYSSGATKLKGYFAWDAAQEGLRPGVIVVHEWWGHNDYVQARARKLAEEGYTAFAIDMYGDGKTADHPKDAMAFMQEALSDIPAAKARFEAGIEQLKNHPTTDPEKMAAIGYCFGGGVVLHAARAGVDLDLVASFHGSLGTEAPAKKDAVKAKVAIFTGAADPMAPPEQVEAVRQEMTDAGVDLVLVSYPGAKHAFTNPAATEKGKKFELPLEYNAEADAKSWSRFLELMTETFPKE